jgi:hypothetical protein
MFQARVQALMSAFTTPPHPRYLVAAAKLYHEDNAASLQSIGFLTRLPNTLGVVSPVIRQALVWDTWQPGDDHTREPSLEWCHMGLAQGWLVVSA